MRRSPLLDQRVVKPRAATRALCATSERGGADAGLESRSDPVAQWIEQQPSKLMVARSNRAGVAEQSGAGCGLPEWPDCRIHNSSHAPPLLGNASMAVSAADVALGDLYLDLRPRVSRGYKTRDVS
jgi:hypothetical protein